MILTRLQSYWQGYPLLRWAVIHWLTWPLGLFLATILMQLLQFFGLLLAGAVVGAVIGAGQAYLLYGSLEERRRWILYSAFGGLIGAYPAYIFALFSLLSWWIAALLVGLSFGGGLAGMQAYALYRAEQNFAAWLGMSLLAALVFSWMAGLFIVWGWPMLLSPSGIFFGLILGYSVEKRKKREA